MNTVLKYAGSKWSIADWIIDNFPAEYEKMTYLEPYFGSGAVFLIRNGQKLKRLMTLMIK
jgi:DNA adenine methylase